MTAIRSATWSIRGMSCEMTSTARPRAAALVTVSYTIADCLGPSAAVGSSMSTAVVAQVMERATASAWR